MQAGSHKAGNMGHIHHQNCPHFIGHFPKLLKVNRSRIGRCTCNNHLGLCLHCNFTQLFIVNKAFIIYPIGYNLKILPRDIHRTSMGQMSAMIQVHSHDSIPRITNCKLHRQIGLRTGMRLYIGIIAAK